MFRQTRNIQFINKPSRQPGTTLGTAFSDAPRAFYVQDRKNMAKDLGRIIVIDLEATCVADDDPRKGTFESEIIEIGVAVLDLKVKEVTHSYGMYIIPEKSEVTPFCTMLTGITAQQLTHEHGAISLEDACAALRSKFTKKTPWASWGDYDRVMLAKSCKTISRAVDPYPFGMTHLNVKNLFSLATGKFREYGMSTALDRIGLPLRGRHHSGKDDAFNIAQVLKYLLEGWSKEC